jgi:hypothetical protein
MYIYIYIYISCIVAWNKNLVWHVRRKTVFECDWNNGVEENAGAKGKEVIEGSIMRSSKFWIF